ncbi:centrin [Theileria orientalis]|uniref:Centrin n=1 Tax=Theileria orientalis TaxID=68886 RepID=A0A976MDW4_THEOR|nr:centrin [Theileria orientalis]
MVFDLSTLRNENLSTISTLVDYVEEPESNVLQSDEEYTPEQLNKLHKNVLNRSLEAEVEEAFSLFDRNGDQKIDFFECQAAFKALRLNISPENVKELYKDLGKDEKDFLTITDFKTLVISRIHTRYNNTEIQKIFNQLQDGTGKITLESLRSSINKIGVDISDEELSLMVSEASSNKTYIPFDDFAKLLKRSWTGDPLDMIFE